MGTNILLKVIIFIIIVLILGQTFLWESTIWTNIAIISGLIWSVFLINYREIIRFIEILFIEIAVRFLDCIAHLQGFKVQKADGALLEQVYRLRYQGYLATGYIKENDDEMVIDKYDPFSTNIIALKKDQIIGSIRILFYNPKSLTIFKYYNVGIPNQDLDQYVEVGRWVNSPEYRAQKIKSPIVTILIGLKTYLYLLKTGKQYIIVILKDKLKKHIEKIFNIKFISPNLLPLADIHINNRKEFKVYFEGDHNVGVHVLELRTSHLFKFLFRY